MSHISNITLFFAYCGLDLDATYFLILIPLVPGVQCQSVLFHTDFIHCLPIIQTTNTMDPKKNLTNNPGVANTPAQPNATNANSSNPNQLSGTASAALSDMAKASPQLALQCQ